MSDRKKIDEYWVLCILVGIFVVACRILIYFQSHSTGLLYIGLPFLISVLVVYLAGEPKDDRWTSRYSRYSAFSLIIFLAGSLALFEGFLCFLMFLPLYFGVVGLVFLSEYLYRRVMSKGGSPLSVSVLPLLLVVSSLEGVTPGLSFDRFNEVTVSKVVNVDAAIIRKNIRQPISFAGDSSGPLQLFPMPYAVNTGSFNEGDIHRSEFRYKRWFVTNVHEGHLSVKLAEVGENFIRTEVIEDTSYISNYLTLHGTLIELESLGEGVTRVNLTVSYDRKLDPAWYFGPLERFGVRQTAGYLIDKAAMGGRNLGGDL